MQLSVFGRLTEDLVQRLADQDAPLDLSRGSRPGQGLDDDQAAWVLEGGEPALEVTAQLAVSGFWLHSLAESSP